MSVQLPVGMYLRDWKFSYFNNSISSSLINWIKLMKRNVSVECFPKKVVTSLCYSLSELAAILAAYRPDDEFTKLTAISKLGTRIQSIGGKIAFRISFPTFSNTISISLAILSVRFLFQTLKFWNTLFGRHCSCITIGDKFRVNQRPSSTSKFCSSFPTASQTIGL